MTQKNANGTFDISFKEKWDRHLTEYLQKISKEDDRSNGQVYRRDKTKPIVRHGYIIDVREGENQIDLIKKYNILAFQKDFKDLIGKPHSCAYYLNSSQVMCYNFFRPLLERIEKDEIGFYGQPNTSLVSLIKNLTGKTINASTAKCRFEYKDNSIKYQFVKAVPRGRGEVSSFDFFIEDDPIRIYFEVKYTESEFGGWSSTKDKSQSSIANHYSYLRSGYADMIDDSIVILNDQKETLKRNHELLNQYYQLFRNILKVGSKDTFSFFIFPKANTSVSDEFSNFVNQQELFGESMTNVKGIHWEDLTKYMTKKFKEKYINYLLKRE